MKYAAIVGAGGGLGSELSKLYLESGWFVFGFDLAASARVSELSEAHPGRFQFDCLDITSDAMVGEAARQVAARTDRLDLLVNAAGIGWATRTIGKDGEYASAHDLRRSCGERLREAGVPPLVICRVMRHSSWETTRKHYAPGDVQQDAEVLRATLEAARAKADTRTTG